MTIFKSSTPVFCRWCGKPLRKWTTTVYVKRQRSEYDGSYGRCVYPSELPRTIDDCRKLSNQHVVSVKREKKYDADAGESKPTGFIDSFAEWDGESYNAVRGFFCTNDCAMDLGAAATRDRDIVGAAYNARIKKLREESK